MLFLPCDLPRLCQQMIGLSSERDFDNDYVQFWNISIPMMVNNTMPHISLFCNFKHSNSTVNIKGNIILTHHHMGHAATKPDKVNVL